MFPWLCQFWKKLHEKVTSKKPNQQASIEGLRLQLPELQVENQMVREIRKKDLKKGQKRNDRILHLIGLLYLPEIISTKIINRHYGNLFASDFGIKKT